MTIDKMIEKLEYKAHSKRQQFEKEYFRSSLLYDATQIEQIVEWLEELKEYRENFVETRNKIYETAYAKGFNDGCAKFSVGQDYNDGITDFANKIKECVHTIEDYYGKEYAIVDYDDIEEIEEKLKGDSNG